jgi:hypothetical protein
VVEQTRFPKFDYYLDESDPDLVVLRRQDGAFVAVFSAQGVTKEDIVEVAREDYSSVLQADYAASRDGWPPRRKEVELVRLPPGYYLELDPDLIFLRKGEGHFVAAFSARGVTQEAIAEVARADYKGEPLPEFSDVR